MNIVPMTAELVPQIAELEKLCFADPWSEKSLSDELTNPFAHFLCAVEEGRAVAYVGCLDACGSFGITNICTSPAYRKRGAAAALLSELIRIANEKNAYEVTLEVRASNLPAISLYTKQGFQNLGIRKRFYANPEEDAIIMTKSLE